MTNVVFIPLDERPCNYMYPKQLSEMTDMNMVLPPKDLLGQKKKPADVVGLLNWLDEVVESADHLIVSIDMLVYGGIVPSRLHTLNYEQCLNRLERLATIKKNNPKLQIHAFNLIMRTPAYNNDDEEPDYYETYGEQIFKLGRLTDKHEQNLLSQTEAQALQTIEVNLPKDVQADYIQRRTNNFNVTKCVIDFVDQRIIDFLIVPLDDNAEFGFTAKEQRLLMYDVDRRNLLDQVHIYPGADEIGCTLFARVFCTVKQYMPEIFIRYASTRGPFVIPRYEDRSLAESIKAHITAAGGVIVCNENEQDFILMVHAPPTGPDNMGAASEPLEHRKRAYFSESNLREFTTAMKHYLAKEKHVALADVALGNGADHSLLQLLAKNNTLQDIMAYAGWNTNGNTMGTVVAHAIIASYYKQKEQTAGFARHHAAFFYARLLEDWGYQARVRQQVTEEVLPPLGLTAKNLGDHVDQITEVIEKSLLRFIETSLYGTLKHKIKLDNVHLPWQRMFEVGFDISLEQS